MTALVITMSLAGAGLARQLSTPADWKWHLEGEATLVQGQDVPQGSWRFVAMPPGWHVTTGPAALLYPAAVEELAGNFTIEAEVFLFPGDGAEGYGVFLGGDGLEAGPAPRFTAFLVRRDGHAAIVRHAEGKATVLTPWFRHEAIVAHTGKGTAKNVVTVNVGPTGVTLQVNGVEVAATSRASIDADGRAGLRFGAGLDVHVGRFDVTRRLAPVPR